MKFDHQTIKTDLSGKCFRSTGGGGDDLKLFDLVARLRHCSTLLEFIGSVTENGRVELFSWHFISSGRIMTALGSRDSASSRKRERKWFDLQSIGFKKK